ncbi:MAG: class A beta-lactamase-related serine hydrolase [Thermomicrobia bacterium]|nr:class A beta-lactamase-related serine hydrolase [Thermomicrobia bacterium]MCA1723085.1 class A beta-lactamase-related serine hydrolase [Thermomicrobia bacterium]
MAHLTNVEEQIRTLISVITGEGAAVGVYARHFGSGREIAVNAEQRFPTASTIKVPILFALYRKAAAGEIDLTQRVTLEEMHRTAGSGVLQDLDVGLQPTVHDLATLMITVSDNQATDMLYQLLGGDAIQQVATEVGMTETRTPRTIRALLYDMVGMDERNPAHTYAMNRELLRTGARNAGGWALNVGDDNDVSTPADMVTLLVRIHRGEDPSRAACDAMIDILKRQKFNTILPLLLPAEIEIAHKTGSLHGVRNDVGIVYASAESGGPYAVAIMSRNLADPIAGGRTLADISRAVWDAFTA